jgi:hypothetical protein
MLRFLPDTTLGIMARSGSGYVRLLIQTKESQCGTPYLLSGRDCGELSAPLQCLYSVALRRFLQTADCMLH